MSIDEHDARSILHHIDDYAYLGRHRLSRAAYPAGDGAMAVRGCRADELGQAVSMWLLEVLDEMRGAATPYNGRPESRYHTVLYATYVERAATAMLAAQWNTSARSVERWRHDALCIYAALVNERIGGSDNG